MLSNQTGSENGAVEEAHHSVEFVKLAKELRQVSNRTIVARLRCHRAHRLRDIKLKEEEIDLQVQLFFKDDEGKKLLLRDTNEILRKDKSIGLFASGAQKKGQSLSNAAASELQQLNLNPPQLPKDKPRRSTSPRRRRRRLTW